MRRVVLSLVAGCVTGLIGSSVVLAGNGPLPDLYVVSMSIESQTPGACDAPPELGVRVQFANQGNADAGAFVVEVNGAQQTVSAGLAAGATSSLWFPGFQAGSNTAIVDATDLVTESDETNNTLSGGSPPTPSPTPTCTPTATPTVTPVPPSETSTPTGGVAVATTPPTSTVADVGLPDVGDGDGRSNAARYWLLVLGAAGALAFSGGAFAAILTVRRLRQG